jgi:hypothetical protein
MRGGGRLDECKMKKPGLWPRLLRVLGTGAWGTGGNARCGYEHPGSAVGSRHSNFSDTQTYAVVAPGDDSNTAL